MLIIDHEDKNLYFAYNGYPLYNEYSLYNMKVFTGIIDYHFQYDYFINSEFICNNYSYYGYKYSLINFIKYIKLKVFE